MPSDFVFELDDRSVYAVLDDALDAEATDENLDDLADQALDYMDQTVPVDTGDLRSVLDKRKTPDGPGVQVGVFEGNRGSASGEEVTYAPDVELGHQTSAGTWVPAQPFIAPAVHALRGK